MRMEKQIVGKHTLAGPGRGSGTQRRALTDSAGLLSAHTPRSHCSDLWDSCLPAAGPLSLFFRQLVERSEVRSPWGPDCFPLEIIRMPERHFRVASFTPLHTVSSFRPAARVTLPALLPL